MLAEIVLSTALAVSAVEDRCISDPLGGWLLVYRYSFTDDNGQRISRETFDGKRFLTEDAAYLCAEQIRRTGVKLPTLDRYGRDSNVMPELITPMEELFK